LLGGEYTVGLLDAGRSFSRPGIGLSSRARSTTNAYLSQSKNGLNAILVAGIQNDAVSSLQKQVLAIRSKLGLNKAQVTLKSQQPREDSAVSPSAKGNVVDEQA
jgi:hypothetical protein